MNDLIEEEEVRLRSELRRVINGRRSHYPKHFTGESLPDDLVQEVLEYANSAPNHKNTFPWRFKVFSGASKDGLMGEMFQYLKNSMVEGEAKKKKVEGFPFKQNQTSHLVAIVVHFDERQRVPEIEETLATACAVQNIYLALSSYGIGGYWSTGGFINRPETHSLLQLATNEKLLGFFYLGRLKKNLELPRREVPVQTIEWIR